MTKKAILTAIGIAAAAALLLIIYIKTDIFKNSKDFAVKEVQQVTRIVISKDTVAVTLDRQNDHWVVDGKGLVKPLMMNQLLYFLQNVEVRSPLPRAAHHVADSALKEGYTITVEAGGRVVKRITVGEIAGTSIGTIGRVEGCNSAYLLYIPGTQFSIASIMTVNVQQWNQNLLLSITSPEIVSIKVDNIAKPARSFKIYRGTDGGFHLMDAYNEREVPQFNPEQLDFYLSFYSELGYKEQVKMSDFDLKTLVLSEPEAIITISTTNGQSEVLKLYLKPNGEEYDAVGRPLSYDRDRLYVVFDGDKKVVLASWVDYDLLLKDVSFFLITS